MNSEVRVGIFVLIALAILTFFLINTGDWSFLGHEKNTYQLISRFTNAVGLKKGAGVSLSGVRIGEVSDIRLDGHRALVEMEINNTIRIPSDSTARISSVGLLGQSAVEIIPGASPNDAKQTGEIPSSDPVTVDQLVAVLQDIGDEATNLVASINDFLYGNEARIVTILENIRAISEEVNVLVEDNRKSLKATVASINRLSDRLNEDIPLLLADIRDLSNQISNMLVENEGEIGESITATKQLLQKLETSADTLQGILDKINNGEGSVGKLLNDPETVENVNDLMDRTANVLVDVENLLTSPPRFQFNYAFRAEYFNKSEDLKYYYRLVTKFGESDHLYVELINDRIHDKPPIFSQGDMESEPNQALDFLGDDFSFSATYGKAIPGGLVRVGIIENETGIALDVGNFFTDRVSFTLEGYDFGRNDGPHIKAMANVHIWEGVHLTIGYDDPLSDSTKQWFYGGGIRF
jgi:phospholipid/cholesterol/gamma-HCH transport system substrate-binding protein